MAAEFLCHGQFPAVVQWENKGLCQTHTHPRTPLLVPSLVFVLAPSPARGWTMGNSQSVIFRISFEPLCPKVKLLPPGTLLSPVSQVQVCILRCGNIPSQRRWPRGSCVLALGSVPEAGNPGSVESPQSWEPQTCYLEIR